MSLRGRAAAPVASAAARAFGAGRSRYRSAMKTLLDITSGTEQHWVGDGFPVRTLFSYDSLGAEKLMEKWSV